MTLDPLVSLLSFLYNFILNKDFTGKGVWSLLLARCQNITMSESALVGQPPRTPNDRLIYRALLVISPSSINPNRNFPFGPPPPPDASHDRREGGMIVGSAIAIAYVTLITASRLIVRKRNHNFGLDDWVIIPAAVGNHLVQITARRSWLTRPDWLYSISKSRYCFGGRRLYREPPV